MCPPPDYHAFKQCKQAVKHYMEAQGLPMPAVWSIFKSSEGGFKPLDNVLSVTSAGAAFFLADSLQVWKLGAATEGVWWQKQC